MKVSSHHLINAGSTVYLHIYWIACILDQITATLCGFPRVPRSTNL